MLPAQEIACAESNPAFIETKMFAQKEALVKLLSDDDPDTVRLVKEQLAAAGEDSLDDLRDLVDDEDDRVCCHAREVIREISGRSAVEEFSLLCHFFGDGVDLEQACLALARAIEPDICTQSCEHRINHWGRKALAKIAGAMSNRERVVILSEFLAGELGFHGNADRYYAEENSLLPRVVAMRAGIPITLTLLYMMVGARAAMKIDGVNMPGHFIARHGEIFFDPFHGGRILSRRDVEDILLRQGLELSDCHIQTATSRQMLLRMLANLRYVYDLNAEPHKLELVRAWMNALNVGSQAG